MDEFLRQADVEISKCKSFLGWSGVCFLLEWVCFWWRKLFFRPEVMINRINTAFTTWFVLKTSQELWMLSTFTLKWRITMGVGIVALSYQKCHQFSQGISSFKVHISGVFLCSLNVSVFAIAVVYHLLAPQCYIHLEMVFMFNLHDCASTPFQFNISLWCRLSPHLTQVWLILSISTSSSSQRCKKQFKEMPIWP